MLSPLVRCHCLRHWRVLHNWIPHPRTRSQLITWTTLLYSLFVLFIKHTNTLFPSTASKWNHNMKASQSVCNICLVSDDNSCAAAVEEPDCERDVFVQYLIFTRAVFQINSPLSIAHFVTVRRANDPHCGTELTPTTPHHSVHHPFSFTRWSTRCRATASPAPHADCWL